MKKDEKNLEKEKNELAMRIMKTSRETMMMSLPYLSRVLFKLPIIFYCQEEELDEDVVVGFGTDGRNIYVIPEMVLRKYYENQNYINHLYLHMVFHCLYQHLFKYETLDIVDWDLAADMAVEHIILELDLEHTALPNDGKRRSILARMKQLSHNMNAETIYHWLQTHPKEKLEFRKDASVFRFDLHHYWRAKDVEGKMYVGEDQSYPSKAKIHEKWKKMERAVQTEILSYEKTQGYEPGSISKKFEGIHYSPYDYSEFLQKFAVMSEEVKVNPDEFDYVYYTYGMSLYGNMPLIEPLEYKEDNRIRDFVVAIDTSGSVQGQLVKNFLYKTWNILKSEKNFFYQVNIHIIQCDAKIQQEVVVHNKQEFDAYMKEIELKGFGGTDFRPVFKRVDELIASKKIQDLRGLIYFTDGKGIFPEVAPSYKTAFIFVDNGFMHPKVPSWAIRLILPVDEFED